MSESGSGHPPSAYVCDEDDLDRRVLAREAEAVGFEVLGEATTAVEMLQVTELLDPDLVLMAFELPGTSGLEATRLLRERTDPPEVILTAHDPAIGSTATEVGAFAVMAPSDLDSLVEALEAVRRLVETGERPRARFDRRSGTDRRTEQDWAKVTSERRSGDERRKGPRREDDERG